MAAKEHISNAVTGTASGTLKGMWSWGKWGAVIGAVAGAALFAGALVLGVGAIGGLIGLALTASGVGTTVAGLTFGFGAGVSTMLGFGGFGALGLVPAAITATAAAVGAWTVGKAGAMGFAGVGGVIGLFTGGSKKVGKGMDGELQETQLQVGRQRAALQMEMEQLAEMRAVAANTQRDVSGHLRAEADINNAMQDPNQATGRMQDHVRRYAPDRAAAAGRTDNVSQVEALNKRRAAQPVKAEGLGV